MHSFIIDETFTHPTIDPQLAWLNPPRSWSINQGRLAIEPDAKTDFWQRTHYGFRADNGHFLFAEVEGDFIITTQARFKPVHQYDQAGLMIRISDQCWLKTSVEYEPDGPSRLGAVVTNQGYSDWSTQNFPIDRDEVTLRVRREGNDYIVEYFASDLEGPGSWNQMRIAHLHADDGQVAVKGGLYACSPIEAGYVAMFDFLRIERGRLK